eukprot:CAMPEP_0204601256 /NCGR_PEP_ID=MMETSP0661-20131031/55918_1 /ASSEMBLY_ACC=CAM_ASM_000606 /TAXON_ID=109239 /ORGANISM="Alexandrium margalefi, Strain AMGDE01CS-322" /LENGTH=59 /DNA_ID=CAMNT_0051612103 /DNA_START=1 /DNA_END=177 /DNA_ORIENTATION=+
MYTGFTAGACKSWAAPRAAQTRGRWRQWDMLCTELYRDAKTLAASAREFTDGPRKRHAA